MGYLMIFDIYIYIYTIILIIFTIYQLVQELFNNIDKSIFKALIDKSSTESQRRDHLGRLETPKPTIEPMIITM